MDIDELLALNILANDSINILSSLSQSGDERSLSPKETEVKEVLGLRPIHNPSLVKVGRGQDKLGSVHNDSWARRCVLTAFTPEMGHDNSIGRSPLAQAR